MSDKLQIELSPEYAEHLELLKQIIPSTSWEQITEDGKMIEALIDSFMAFIQEQAGANHEHEHGEWGCGWHGHGEEGCCGWKNHNPEVDWKEWCGCN